MAGSNKKRDVVREAKLLLAKSSKLAEKYKDNLIFWGAFALVVNFFLNVLLITPLSGNGGLVMGVGIVTSALSLLVFLIGRLGWNKKAEEYDAFRKELGYLVECYEKGSADFDGLDEISALKKFQEEYINCKYKHQETISAIELKIANDIIESTFNKK